MRRLVCCAWTTVALSTASAAAQAPVAVTQAGPYERVSVTSGRSTGRVDAPVGTPVRRPRR